MNKLTQFVPEGLEVETIVGVPPKDQSQEVLIKDQAILALQEENYALKETIDILTRPPAPEFLGPEIVVPEGVAGTPISPIPVSDRFSGTGLIFNDNDLNDTIVTSSDGIISGTYPEGSVTVTVNAIDGWNRQATSTPVVIVGNPPVISPPPPPPPPPENSELVQYLISDGGDGPTKTHWSQHLLIPWKNSPQGDWIDANGDLQGSVPYASATINAVGIWTDLDVTALAVKAENKGWTLKSERGDGPSFAGRESLFPPALVVSCDQGVVTKVATATANYSSSSSSGSNTRSEFKVQSATPAIIQFDLADLTGITSATLRLYSTKIWGKPPTISIYECDSPRIVVGSDPSQPVILGLAHAAGSEAALKNYPGVLVATDFSDPVPKYAGGSVFDSVSIGTDVNGNPLVEFLPDPKSPGTIMARGMFEAGSYLDGDRRGSCSFKTEHMPADQNIDPMCGPVVVYEEMFARLYVELEDDWNSILDSNKMAIGWDLRMGWWNGAKGGYWQSITGNGGARGDGKRRTVPRKSPAILSPTQREYWGHAIRMEAGKASSAGNRYGDLRPIQSYAYHLDQATSYGDMIRLGTRCIKKNDRFCIEQQIKLNSLTGPEDFEGNREAVPDGILRTWLNGQLVHEVTNLRFRRHPDMGVQGPWINWFYGGKQPSERNMHYRMNHLVVATNYIGMKAD